MCYGTCPVYEVVFHREGSASWRGEAFTTRIGEFEGQIDERDFQRLADFIYRVGFFDWEDEYLVPVTDNPAYELDVVRGTRKKRVVQYATDEPPDFWVVATLIDAMASGVTWERRGS
jgi:hypothetical protein